jgi:hypothetical protein
VKQDAAGVNRARSSAAPGAGRRALIPVIGIWRKARIIISLPIIITIIVIRAIIIIVIPSFPSEATCRVPA